jgi:hypothetical protein
MQPAIDNRHMQTKRPALLYDAPDPRAQVKAIIVRIFVLHTFSPEWFLT